MRAGPPDTIGRQFLIIDSFPHGLFVVEVPLNGLSMQVQVALGVGLEGCQENVRREHD